MQTNKSFLIRLANKGCVDAEKRVAYGLAHEAYGIARDLNKLRKCSLSQRRSNRPTMYLKEYLNFIRTPEELLLFLTEPYQQVAKATEVRPPDTATTGPKNNDWQI